MNRLNYQANNSSQISNSLEYHRLETIGRVAGAIATTLLSKNIHNFTAILYGGDQTTRDAIKDYVESNLSDCEGLKIVTQEYEPRKRLGIEFDLTDLLIQANSRRLDACTPVLTD